MKVMVSMNARTLQKLNVLKVWLNCETRSETIRHIVDELYAKYSQATPELPNLQTKIEREVTK